MADRYSTVESILALGQPHPDFAQEYNDNKAAITANKFVGNDYSNLDILNQVRASRKALLDADHGQSPSSVKESTKSIPMRDGHSSEIRIFQPAKPTSKASPLVILYFGGGFVMGENRTMAPYARGVVQLFGAVAVTVTYRLAPENPFPVGHNDAWDSFRWIIANASSLSADPSAGLVVGGISAGGNMSIIIAQNAIEQSISPPITGIWACVPLVFPSKSHVPEKYHEFYLSQEQNLAAPLLNPGVIAAFNGHLRADVNSQWYAPGNARDPFKGYPKTYIQVDGLDPLRDDGLILEKLLRANGAETRVTAWKGLPHAHFAFFPDKDYSKDAVSDTFRGFGWLLGLPEPEDEVIRTTVEPPTSG